MAMVLFMDSFAIFVEIFIKLPRIFENYNDMHAIMQVYFLWPFCDIFRQGSTFMIVSMAFERYFASRNPLSTHQVMSASSHI